MVVGDNSIVFLQAKPSSKAAVGVTAPQQIPMLMDEVTKQVGSLNPLGHWES